MGKVYKNHGKHRIPRALKLFVENALLAGSGFTETGTETSSKYQVARQSTLGTWSEASKSNKIVATAVYASAKQGDVFQRSGDATTRITGTVGRQTSSDVAYLLSDPDLDAMILQASLDATGKMFITHAELFCELHNQSNTGVKVWIYDLVCKLDDCGSPSTCWNRGLSTDQGAAAGAYLYPYSFPQATKDFSEAWEIIKVTRLSMEAGQSHVHNFDHYINKVLDPDRLQGTSTFVAGFTTAQMIVTLGSLDNDTTTKSQISYGASAINYYSKYKYTFMCTTTNSLSTVSAVSVPTAFTVGQSTMLEDADATATYAAA